MGAGYHGGFGNTLGSTFANSNSSEETYSDRGIEIPENLKVALSRLKEKGDYIVSEGDSFSMKDVSIMSKESGVEFAKVFVDGKTYLIRGDKSGTVIPDSLLTKMKNKSGRLEFHSHPHNDDCIPSKADMKLMGILKKVTGQRISMIVTPNGRTCTFDENGVISIGTVINTIDASHQQALLKLFGGN